MLEDSDKLQMRFDALINGYIKGGKTYFTREFFDHAAFAYRHYYETVEDMATQVLALFLDVPEERVYELLQEESQPQTKEGEGQLQQGTDES